MSRYKRTLKIILVLWLLIFTTPLKVFAENYSVTKRIAGNTRVETSIEVSKNFYTADSSFNVVLAGYHGEVDALTGTLLASSMNAPLLLVDKFTNIEDELLRLGVKNVYLLGGEMVIDNSIENDLQRAGYEVNRIDGESRLGTAVAVAKETMQQTDHVFLTNDGRSGALVDALAVGPISGMYLSPIMLTTRDTISSETLDAIIDMKVKQISIIGGTSAVSEEVENVLASRGLEVKRISGDNRWQTAEKIAELYLSPGAAIVVNDGYSGSLADALVSGHIGAKLHVPLLLTGTHSLNEYTKNYLLKSPHLRYVLGGESVISKKTFEEIIKTEGDTITVDTEEEIRVAKYNFTYIDGLPKDEEVIVEFARNGKSVTTYKSVMVQGEVVENVRVHTKWMTYPTNGLIHIGTGSNLTESIDPFLSHENLFEQSGWQTGDFIIKKGQILGFSKAGKYKARNEFRGLALVLPGGDSTDQSIHTVGPDAFKEFYFQRLDMPDSIKEIQEGAFQNMSLVYTKFPSQLEIIGKNSFSGNGFSNRVTFDSLQSLTKIDDDAFNSAFFGDTPCTMNLESLHSLKTIGKGAFVGNQIQSIILPNGLKSIGPDAFMMNLIDQVVLPSSLEYVDEMAFDENVQLMHEKDF